MSLEIHPVSKRRARREFLTFPRRVFRGDRLWVPPVLSEMEARIDPQRGAWFTHGLAECFIALRDGKLAGTICCAEDKALNARLQRHDAVFGFNHYLPDYAVAAALWDHAASWARAHELEALFGPFNLDYEDAYGILIEGYDRPPALMCGHTPPYYREFIERYGFGPARAHNVALEVPASEFSSPEGSMAKLHRAAEIARKRGRVSVRSGNLDDWDNEVARLLKLLNSSLAVLTDFLPWERESLESLAGEMRRFIDPDLVLFAEVDGQCVGFLLGLPNLNEALIHANGLRYPWDALRAWWALRRRPQCLCLKSILVEPSYWGRGVDAILLHEMGERAIAKGYTWGDLSITATDNPMTVRMGSRLGARIYKRWQVYIKSV